MLDYEPEPPRAPIDGRPLTAVELRLGRAHTTTRVPGCWCRGCQAPLEPERVRDARPIQEG